MKRALLWFLFAFGVFMVPSWMYCPFLQEPMRVVATLANSMVLVLWGVWLFVNKIRPIEQPEQPELIINGQLRRW